MLLHITEGQPYDVMLRVAELLLALRSQTSVWAHFARQAARPAWRALLGGPEQLALRELAWDSGADPDLPLHAQAVWVCGGAAVPARPAAATWLVLSHAAGAADPDALQAYDRAFCLPPAVALQPVGAPRHGPPAVLVIHAGDMPATRRLVRWLGHAGAPRVRVLDPYGAVADAAADPHVDVVVCPSPAQRVALYATCGAVAVGAATPLPDNHFFWEARRCGLAALGAAVPAATVWSAALCRMVVRAWQRGAIAYAPLPLTWEAAVEQFWATPTTLPAPRTYGVAPHQVRQFASLHQAQASPPSVSTELLLCPGEAASVPPELAPWLRAYRTVFIDTTCNARFLVALLAQGILQPLQPVHAALAAWLHSRRGPGVVPLDIVHLDASRDHIGTTAQTLAALFAASSQALPTLLLHVHKGDARRALSTQRMGLGVATDALTAGLQHAAPGRYQLRWLTPQSPRDARGRLYFYPFAAHVGLDGDEIDYPMLPQLLRDQGVDLLCCLDPHLTGVMAARALWARRNVPVVGMLHSLHTAAVATDVLWQQLSTASLPGDALVSPSHCGAQAFGALLDAAAAWLAPRLTRRPAYQGDIAVIPYGIDGAPFADLQRASCRQALGLHQDGLLLLSLGRLHRREKADLLPLLLSMVELRRRGHPVQLLLAGGRDADAYDAQLLHLVGELHLDAVVHIRADVAAVDKVLMYGAADIFVALSDTIQETYGLTLVEAMAASLPVVAAGWNGYRELVRHGTNGFLVPTVMAASAADGAHVQRLSAGLFGYGHADLHECVAIDGAALTRSLERLVGQAGLRQRLGGAGRALWQAHYEIRTQGRRLAEFLLERVARAAAAPAPSRVPPPFADTVRSSLPLYAPPLPPTLRVGSGAPTALTCWQPEGRQERLLLTELCRHVEAAGTVALGDLAVAVATQLGLAPESVALRIARCLKYGLLRLL